MSLTFIDLFAGIGGFRLGMEQAGHKCLGYVEWDKFARKSYEAIHNSKGEWTAHDITTVTDDDLRLLRGQVDVICGGFPCQAFSIAGKRLGFAETRGTLFFEIARFAKEIQPRYLFLENVKGLLSHDSGNTFATILSTLDELGYDCSWELLNSKNFGVPQNRERVFIVGYLRGRCTREVFPIGRSCETVSVQRVGNINPSGNGMNGNVYSIEGVSPTLTTNKGEGLKIIQPVLTPDRAEKKQNGRRMKEPGEPMFTLTAQDRHGIYDGYRIRRLTPKECWRLQGFPNSAFDKAREVNSDSQLYKQAGNSVTVPVIYEIAKRLV
ncbi:DNA (cytosine-5-)-methyltransferase [Bacillus cereus]|uniref:DNA (cytosine-5-)-methyltransferase n=1 Tax=Bacillus cereus TaxID=1396 RepID=UPI000BF84C34|nr:DNA (cytosine-5-)-methyltransferase [Bacillus cereus]PET50497.1 DNA (cytosine-5-)-methyltransferase [Bacillus cereus]PFL86602.1 DNA (cytosine-5-)-methyltransferase [Bacillus cereus]